MKTPIVLVLVLVLVLDSSIFGEPLSLERAIQPLAGGIPQVAVVRLRAFLAGQISDEERRTASLRLAEALIATQQPQEALPILEDPRLRELPASKMSRARALAALGRWAEALPMYEQSATEANFHAEALLGRADALRALDRGQEALRLYAQLQTHPRWGVRAQLRTAELLLARHDLAGAARILEAVPAKSDADLRERRFLRGALEMESNRDRATESFASILRNPQGTPHSVVVAALFGVAEAHLRSHTPEEGDDFLEGFIERHPDDEALPALFAKLDQLYAAARRQSRHDLGKWSRDPVQPRRALAQWYLARAELRRDRRDLALQVFARLRTEHPPLPVLAEAFLEYAQLQLDEERYDDASATLERARALHPPPDLAARIGFLAGRIHYRTRRFDQAAEAFQRVALSSETHATDALVNASLAWMQAENNTALAATAQELEKRGANDETRGDLRLEEALLLAARAENGAPDSLRAFLRDFPTHPRRSEASVAVAELAFHATPARLEEARQQLKQATEQQPTPAAQERADYLLVWIESSTPQPNESNVIDAATRFLEKYPASTFASDVRLKLAETSFRRQDFASAQTQFTLLAQQNPAGPLTEKAQFFAAQAAAQSMAPGTRERALELFDEVVKKNSELKWAARNEQAALERQLGKPEDALTLYEEVLKGDAGAAEKREALCGKGDILYERGTAEPGDYRRAIEVYAQLAAEAEVASHWRNQALFKKGMCLEKLNAPAEALATFYEIVEDGSRPDRRREFFWFYKAGFNAARLLEEQSNWQPAAALYEKLAFAGGARSEEARSRLNRLRLEHFLWDQ